MPNILIPPRADGRPEASDPAGWSRFARVSPPSPIGPNWRFPASTPAANELGTEFRRRFGEQLAKNLLWTRGVVPGGSLAAKPGPFKELGPAERAFRLRVGFGVIDYLRNAGVDAMDHVRQIGRAMAAGGVPAQRDPDVSDGVFLAGGDKARIDPELLRALCTAQAAVVEHALRWTWSLPDGALRYRLPQKPLAAGEILAPVATGAGRRPRMQREIYGLALTLGCMSDHLYERLKLGVTASGSGVPSHAEAFSPSLLASWGYRQLNAWLRRKEFESGAPECDAYEAYKRLRLLPPEMQVMASIVAPGILEYLRLSGKAGLRELLCAGSQMLEHGYALPEKGFLDPPTGIPLLNGTLARIEPSLLYGLALAHHLNWLRSRETTRLLPAPHLHQPPNSSRLPFEVWDPAKGDMPAPESIRLNMGNVYWIAYVLADWAIKKPAEFQALYAASVPG